MPSRLGAGACIQGHRRKERFNLNPLFHLHEEESEHEHKQGRFVEIVGSA